MAGGNASGQLHADVWELGPTGWTAIPNDIPSSVSSYAAAWNGRAVMLIGGTDLTGYVSTVREFDGTWSTLTGTAPQARIWASATWDATRSRLVFFGGNRTSGLQNDTWEFY
jgi:hypothetical protein